MAVFYGGGREGGVREREDVRGGEREGCKNNAMTVRKLPTVPPAALMEVIFACSYLHNVMEGL